MILARIQLQIQDFCWIFVHSGSSAKSLIFHDFKIQIRCHKRVTDETYFYRSIKSQIQNHMVKYAACLRPESRIK